MYDLWDSKNWYHNFGEIIRYKGPDSSIILLHFFIETCGVYKYDVYNYMNIPTKNQLYLENGIVFEVFWCWNIKKNFIDNNDTLYFSNTITRHYEWYKISVEFLNVWNIKQNTPIKYQILIYHTWFYISKNGTKLHKFVT